VRGVTRPYFLRQLYWLSLALGGLSALFLVLAPLNVGDYYIGDQHLTGREFLGQGGWLTLLGLCFFSAWIVRDLHFGLPRLRFVLLGLWALGLTAWRPSVPNAEIMLAEYLAIGTLLAWYLFGKEAPRRYFVPPRGLEPPPSAG